MTEVIIVLGGIIIGILGVLVGATQFLMIPFFQWLQPSMTYAQIIGNTKTGGFFRSIASSISTLKQIDFKVILENMAPYMAGTIIGSILTNKIDQNYLLIIIIAAIVISELSPKIAHLINKKTRLLFSILVGIYAGFIGAGTNIMIIALLRTSFPKQEDLVFVKIQAGVVELFGLVIIASINLFFGNIIWPLVLYWSVGMFIGGYIGGHLLKKTVHISKKMQRIYVYIIYVVALIPLIIKAIYG